MKYLSIAIGCALTAALLNDLHPMLATQVVLGISSIIFCIISLATAQ